jgi:hypothetical protein
VDTGGKRGEIGCMGNLRVALDGSGESYSLRGVIMKDYFLKTTRLGFSVWNQGDLPKAIELWGNPEVTKFIAAKGIMSNEQIHQRLNKEIETYEAANIQYWPVYLIEDDTNIDVVD